MEVQSGQIKNNQPFVPVTEDAKGQGSAVC